VANLLIQGDGIVDGGRRGGWAGKGAGRHILFVGEDFDVGRQPRDHIA